MFKIENKRMHLTRGDVALIEVKAKNNDGSDYAFKKGDVVRISVFKCKDCGCVEIIKDVTVDEPKTSVDIFLSSEDTTIGDLINKPVKYWYEITLNPDTDEQTIIGYDDEGPKEFILYPEAKEPVKPKLTIEFQTDNIEGYLRNPQPVSGDFGTLTLESYKSYTEQVSIPMTKDITWDNYHMGQIYIDLYVNDIKVSENWYDTVQENITSPITMLSNELIDQYNITVNSKVCFKLHSTVV